MTEAELGGDVGPSLPLRTGNLGAGFPLWVASIFPTWKFNMQKKRH
jgi:hypothetical protein